MRVSRWRGRLFTFSNIGLTGAVLSLGAGIEQVRCRSGGKCWI
jgi:hypothetical protein